MRVIFIQDSALNESLALTELSAVLKSRGHATRLLIAREERDLYRKIREFSPDLFYIPCSLFSHRWTVRMAQALKSQFDKPVVVSGTHPTFFPEIIENNTCIDVICIGEAELSISELLRRMERKEDITTIPNLWVRVGQDIHKNAVTYLLDDLDLMPLPDRELYYGYGFIRGMSMKRFSSGRGCCHSCAYCLEPILRAKYATNTRYVRKKSVGRVIAEIAAMRAKFPLSSLHFSDDSFTYDKRWLLEFVQAYKKEIGLPFTFNADVDELDEEIIAAVKDAHCTGIAIGIETGNERIRNFVMEKAISNADVVRIAGAIKKNRLKLITFNMIALPGETIDDAFETLAFNNAIRTDYVRLTIAFPMPQTRFTQFGLANGHLDAINDDVMDAHLGGFLKDPYPIFKSADMVKFRNLYYFFRLGIKFPFLRGIIRRLVNAPPLRVFKLLNLLIPYDESKIFRIRWLSGFRYFLHVGNPMKRTTTYPTLT